MAEFSSVVEAVRCAIHMKREMEERARTEIKFRIGVHVGDVIADANDVFGDGVNIAARLEALAEPGVCISARVYEDVARIDGEFADGGEQRLKNIDRPTRVYRCPTQWEKPYRTGRQSPVCAISGFSASLGGRYTMSFTTALPLTYSLTARRSAFTTAGARATMRGFPNSPKSSSMYRLS